MLFWILLLISTNTLAFTLNNNIDAGFSKNKIEIRVSENSNCTNAGVTKEDLLEIAQEAASKFWNRVPSSNLHLKMGGLFSTSDSLFLTGVLCITDSVISCDSTTAVPKVNDIVIACNSNTSENFTSSGLYALTLPNNIANKKIKGSVILINDSNDTPFSGLSRSEMVNVIAHELGHAIGIGHSPKTQSLMYSRFYPGRDRLGQDDIDAVTYLYPNKLDGCSSILATIATIDRDDSQLPPGGQNSNWMFVITLFSGLSLCFLMKKFTTFLFKKITQSNIYRRQRVLKYL